MEKPTIEKVIIKIIKKLNNGNSPEKNKVKGELIKHGVEKLWRKIIYERWIEERKQEKWKMIVLGNTNL